MEMTIRARDRRGGRARTPMHALTHTGEKGRYRGGRTERTETLGVARYGEKGGVERELGWKERGERKRETKRNETKERKKERKKNGVIERNESNREKFDRSKHLESWNRR